MHNALAPQQSFSMQMVAELAAKIQEPKDILERYGVSAEEFSTLSKNPAFRSAYQEAKQFWESDANARDRIAVKSLAMLEDSLLELHNIFHDAQRAGDIRLKAFQQMTVLARVNGGEQKDQAGRAGQTVNIHIDMGNGHVLTAQAQQPAIDGEYSGEDNE